MYDSKIRPISYISVMHRSIVTGSTSGMMSEIVWFYKHLNLVKPLNTKIVHLVPPDHPSMYIAQITTISL